MNMLREIRLEKNMTQHELAVETGLTHTSISRYESGKRKISVETAQKLAEALNVEWTVIFEGKENERKNL